jgi:hypothetical protein
MRDQIEALIAHWHDITAPNDVAHHLVDELADTLRAFAAQRGTLQFEDEPASFEAALRDARA